MRFRGARGSAGAGWYNHWHRPSPRGRYCFGKPLEFGTTSISNSSATFSTAAAGPWVASPNPATGYRYARVTATVPVALYFLPLVVAKSTFSLVSSAAAGQIAITAFKRGVAPYTAVSTNTTGPSFGLVVGNSYDI